MWVTQFPWANMLRSETREVHHVKFFVCSFVKGNDVILGPKANTLEKHMGKKGYSKHATLGQKTRRMVCQ